MTESNLDLGEARAPRGVDPREDVLESVAARDLPEALALQRIEAHRDPGESGVAESFCVIGEEKAVRRERDLPKGGVRREPFDQVGEIPAQEGLSAGEPDLVDSESGQNPDEPRGLLETEEVALRKPDVLFLRHAVEAAEVAAVGHRHPEAPQRSVATIGDGRHRASLKRRGERIKRPGLT